MSIAWRLALRDLRAGRRGLVLLAICLLLGTAALAGIGSLSSSILAALDAQGRTALGGDLEMRVSQRRATIEEQAAFAAQGALSETIRMRAMAEHNGATALVDLKGVDAHWPLVGRLRLQQGALAARPRGLEAIVAPALADRLRAHVGDTIRIGSASVRIVGLIAEEPDKLGESFRLGPPVIIDLAALDATALVQPGSLYDSRYRLRLADPVRAAALGDRLEHRFPNAGWSSRTAKKATETLQRAIGQLGQFLLLVGLSSLAIAAVGVGSGVSAYLAGKTRMIATLKVLGARSTTIATIFLLELGLVAGAGIVAGVLVGAAVPWIVSGIADDVLPVLPRLALYPEPLLTAAALGLIATLLAALPALARARAVPAASLLRDALGTRQRLSVGTLAMMALLAAALIALAILGASDRRLAAGFVVGISGLLLLLGLLGVLIRIVLERLPRPRAPLLRLAVANLHRPGAPTGRLVVALGVGFSLFVALAIIDTSLAGALANAAPSKAPRFFAIDLQPEDEKRFRTTIAHAAPTARIEAVPSLRGAVVAIKGRRVEDMASIPPDAWILRGDRTLTWSATLPPRNRVVAGAWWPRDYHGPPLVSLGADAAKALDLHIGDPITISVLGVDVPARIAALREIDWGGLGLNFAIIFSPGYIEEAPHSLLASVYAPPGSDGAIASVVGTALPSVSLIRVGDVISQIGDLLGQIAVAIRAAGTITVAAGIVVLLGAVAASADSRRYDSVILKLVGGTRRQVLSAQAIEYALLAALLSIVALIVGGGAGWYVVVHVLALPFTPSWGVVAATLAASAAATLVIGVAGSWRSLSARPAEALRSL